MKQSTREDYAKSQRFWHQQWVEIDLRRWMVIARVPTPKYPVGLGVAPDED